MYAHHIQYYCPRLTHLLTQQWQDKWLSVTTYLLLTIYPSVIHWHSLTHRNRWWETALAHLQLGHTKITHGFLMERGSPPVCHSCQVRLQSYTFLSDNPLLWRISQLGSERRQRESCKQGVSENGKLEIFQHLPYLLEKLTIPIVHIVMYSFLYYAIVFFFLLLLFYLPRSFYHNTIVSSALYGLELVSLLSK